MKTKKRFSLCGCLVLAAAVTLGVIFGTPGTLRAQSIDSSTWYEVVNQTSGLCMDATGEGTTNGTTLQQWACGNQQANQEWQFQPAATGGYDAVYNRNATSLVWDNEGSTAAGNGVWLWTYGSGNTNQEWQPNYLGNGLWDFINLTSGMCLDNTGSTANGTQMTQWTCASGNTNQEFSLVAVSSPTPTPTPVNGEAPYGGTPAAIPGTVMAENYDTGGQGVAYNVTSINGTDNGYRSDGIDLETATSPATGNDLGWTAAGQWFRYTVNVSTAGTYTVSFLVAGGSGASVSDAFHLSDASGTNLSGAVAVPNTGGWQTWTTVTATVTLPAGTQTLTLNEDAGGWNIDSMAFASSGGGTTEAPYGGTPAAIAGTVMAENYDTGGQGVAYNVTSTNGTDNGYRSDGVDLETATSPATGNDLGWSAAGQWFNYTVNVSSAGTYSVSFLVAGGSGSAVTDAFHLSDSSGTNLTGAVAVPNTGGWQTWTTVTATVTLPAGTQMLTLNEDAGGWNIDSMAFASGSGCGTSCGAPAQLFAPFEYLGDLSDANQVPGIVADSGAKAVVLAFLDPYNNSCSLIWPGANGPLPNDTIGSTSVGSVIAQLQAQGVTVIISGGGAGATDGSAYCSSAAEVQSLYQSVINQYHVNWLDFDIEIGQTSGQVQRRDQALAALQAANPGLIVSYTLPLGTNGLDAGDNGTGLLTSAKTDGLNLNVVNGMAMDFGPTGVDQATEAEEGAAALENQIQSYGLNSTVGLTVLPGTSDDNPPQYFTLSDANTVLNFAQANSYVSLLSFWELNRDNGGCPGSTTDQDTCSGISQSPYEFSSIFDAF